MAMKNKSILLVLIAVLLVTVMAFVSPAKATETVICPHCNTALSAITDWQEWPTSGTISASGHYRLTSSGDTYGQVQVTGGTVILDLNGKTLSTVNNSATAVRPLYAKGGELHVYDTSAGKTGTVIGKQTSTGGTVYVHRDGTMHIHGGTFKNNAASCSNGGVVNVVGRLTLHGGVIEGKKSTSGGAVYCNGLFTMEGGTITGGESTGAGGTVYVAGGTFTLNDGTIEAGTAATSGGTIFAAAGTLNLNGGTVEYGTVGSNKYGKAVYAGNCIVNIGSVNIPGAISANVNIASGVTLGISGAPKIGYMSINAASAPTIGEMTDGAQVHLAVTNTMDLAAANDQMQTYLDKGYFLPYTAGKVLTTDGASLTVADFDCPCCDAETVTWTVWNGTAENGKHYYLTEDLELTAAISIAANTSVTLDLRGKQIVTNASNTLLRAFMVRGNLNIVDSGITGKVISGATGANGGVFSVQDTGNLELFGGKYVARVAPSKGSVAYVLGNMIVHDGVILDGSNAQNEDALCSTVYVKGNFSLDGGAIKGATAGSGGSIYVEAGTLEITGGNISGGNIKEGGYGKEIYVSNATNVTLADCTVADQVQINKADLVIVSGGVQLGHLKLSSSVRITLGALTAAARIPVIADGEFTFANENAATYLAAGYILSGKSNMEIVAEGNVLVMQGLPGVKCPHCGSATLVWNVWSPSATAAGHYYLEESAEIAKEFAVNADMIIDLRGNNITSTTRAFNVKSGTLTVVDTKGGAEVTGAQTGNGGVLYVTAGATLDLMGGKYVAGAKASKGGVAYVPAGSTLKIRNGAAIDGNGKACSPVYVGGFVYMYGGEIKGSSASLGGSVHVYDTGYFELSGGKIYGGSGSSLTSTYALGGDNVYVQGGRMVMSGGTIEAEDSTHLGTAILGTESARITLTGTADPEILSGKVLVDSTCTFSAQLGAGAVNSLGRTTWHSTNAKALNSTGLAMLRLYSDAPLNLTKDVTVDLNGHKVTVSGDYKLSAIDTSATIQKAGTGEATFAGEVAQFVSYDGDRFYPLTENGKITFHRLRLRISAVSLRAKEAGIYYQSSIYCDPTLAAKITSYGVAVSVAGMPDENFAASGSGCLFTKYETENFKGGRYTSGLISGILKSGREDNLERGQMDIYANPYIYLDGKLIMGQAEDTAVWNLKKVMQSVNRIYPTLNSTQTGGVKAMAEKYAAVMEQWNLHNLKADMGGTYEVKRLKVLTLGHSLAVDAGRMLAWVGYQEGATDITVGTLYYSGCTLTQHANYLTYDTPCYDLYYSNLTSANEVPAVTNGVTMKQGLQWDDWDIIVMQAGVFEAGRAGEYDGDIQTILNYIQTYKPDAKIMWNMTWAAPEDDSLLNDSYKSNFTTYFDKDQLKMHSAICDAIQTKILTNSVFSGVIPSGTAIQNANSSYMTDKDLYRDYIHVTDLGRLIAAYTWYCRLTDRSVEELQVDVIPGFLRFNAADQNTDKVLTETEKAIVLESVRNALANPYQVTQSVYTNP